MAEYKISYFPAYGRAEPIVIMLAHANASYERCDIEMAAWPAKKAEWGGCGLPQLEFKDGSRMGEATSMMRFLASKLGYYSSDAMIAYQCDMLIDTFQPLI